MNTTPKHLLDITAILVAEMLVEKETVNYDEFKSYIQMHNRIDFQKEITPEIFNSVSSQEFKKIAGNDIMYTKTANFGKNPLTFLRLLDYTE